MKQLELNFGVSQEIAAQEYWKKKYDDLMASYIKLEEKLYALRTSVALLKEVALENGKAG